MTTSDHEHKFKIQRVEGTNPIDDSSTLLWRYMDFPSFTSLVLKSSIYFPRVDQMSDAWEAYAIPHPEYEKHYPNFFESPQIIQSVQKLARAQYINCWHMNESESYAMWKIYDPSNHGVAIKISAEDLWKAFEAIQVPRPSVIGGQVRYVDYDTPLPLGNMYYPVFAKRKNFAFENEYRFVSTYWPMKNQKIDFENLPPGIYQPVDLNILLKEIYISPFAPNWIEETYREFLQKVAIEPAITKSKIADNPPPVPPNFGPERV